MTTHTLTGTRIREKRLDKGLRQSDLAAAVGISPSYLNLIEHNRRRIGGKLLGDIAKVLEVDASLLNEGVEATLLDQIRAAAVALNQTVEFAKTEEFASRYPGWGALIAKQATQIAALDARAQAMSNRLAFDPNLSEALHEVISAVTSIRSTASILVGQEQLDADWQRRFHTNIDVDSRRLAQSSEALVAYLKTPSPEADKPVSALEEVEAFLAKTGFFVETLETGACDVDAVVAQAGLSKLGAGRLRDVLAIYVTDAGALPIEPFAARCRELNYDPLLLSTAFDVEISMILRRMAVLQVADGHPVMGLTICDASGALMFVKPAAGFSLPRFGGVCPLWPMFRAFARPGQPVCMDVILPGSESRRMRCYSIADTVGPADFAAPPALHSTMLILPDQPDDMACHPVGVTCRICPRTDCASRRDPVVSGDNRTLVL